ncbi:hypothetical protein ACVWZ1_002807, partial [Thermostichus sp. MS-CIW-25]
MPICQNENIDAGTALTYEKSIRLNASLDTDAC